MKAKRSVIGLWGILVLGLSVSLAADTPVPVKKTAPAEAEKPQPADASTPETNTGKRNPKKSDAAKGKDAESDDADTDDAKKDYFAGQNWAGKTIIMPVKGPIFPDQYGGQENRILAALDKALKEKPKLFVVEIESPGGMVSTCLAISKRLNALSAEGKVPTRALVLNMALSGGAMVATACNDIYMVKGGTIGDIQPMSGSPGAAKIDARTWEKTESPVRAMLRANASVNNHPIGLMNAMVSRSVQLYLIKFSDGKQEFMEKHNYELLQESIKSGVETRTILEQKIIIAEGKLLTLISSEAKELGLAEGVIDSRAHFYEQQGIDLSTSLTLDIAKGKYDPLGQYKSIRKLNLAGWHYMLLSIFLMMGIAGTLTEFNTPGFGIPGAFGIIGFGCFFSLLFLEGRAEPFEIAMFLVGVILLVVEIVILPGFGVPGLMGAVCIFGAMVLAFLPKFGSVFPEGMSMWSELSDFTLLLFSATVAASILTYLLVLFGAKLPGVKHLFHETSLRSGSEVREASRAAEADEPVRESPNARYLGQAGTAQTYLRPAGKVLLDSGELIDVVTQGGLIAEAVRVRVIDTRMNRIVVALAPSAAAASDESTDTDAPENVAGA